MDRFLFIFGILIFFFSFIFFAMNFIGEFKGIAMIISVFAMLNASIAIGVSEILSKINNLSKHLNVKVEVEEIEKVSNEEIEQELEDYLKS